MDRKIKRQALAVIGGAALIGGGYYFASPYLVIHSLRSGFISRNAEQVSKYIDYPALQVDLKSQLSAMMLKKLQDDPEMASNPFSGLAFAMVTPIINTMVDSYVTPSGLKTFFSGQSSGQGESIPDQNAQGLSKRAEDFKKAQNKVSMGYEGVDRFHLTVTNDDGQNLRLLLNRQGFADWKLKSIAIPQI